MIYFRPLCKRVIYPWLITLLVVSTILAVAFVLTFALYLSEKVENNEAIGIASVILFYICWIMVAGGIIFISPGLCKNKHDFPLYRITMIITYLVFTFVYPFLVIAAVKEPTNSK